MRMLEKTMGSVPARVVRRGVAAAGSVFCIGRAGGQCAWLAPAMVGVRFARVRNSHSQLFQGRGAGTLAFLPSLIDLIDIAEQSRYLSAK